MKYINLLGEEIDTDEERKKQRGINPMVKSCGKGPPDRKQDAGNVGISIRTNTTNLEPIDRVLNIGECE